MPCYDVIADKASSSASEPPKRSGQFNLALVGNPNTGKTSLFNALTGLRTRTANLPGTTVEHRSGTIQIDGERVILIDLPGMYSLASATPDEHVARDALDGNLKGVPKPDAVIVIVDADNLERNLFLVTQLLEREFRVVVALNMTDVARRHGIKVNAEHLSRELGCPVVPTLAHVGEGLDEIKSAIRTLLRTGEDEVIHFRIPEVACGTCGHCPFGTRYAHTEDIALKSMDSHRLAGGHRTERIDKVLTNPVVGLAAFFAVIMSVFYLIFSVASLPMDLIDAWFGHMGSAVAAIVPEGDLQSLLVDGIIAGVGGILVFLPQICILFFFLALLEDSGYLSRAAFVMDKLMRRVGLPGTAFIPLLSAHACAIPAIMATRVIKDRRDRLVTILIAPLMTCSARIPVYAMVTALLFPHEPGKAALVFTGAYALGISTALVMAWVFKKTILPGESKPLVLELPVYKRPSLRSALFYTWDRSKVFVQQAGTIILLISITLWALATYPKSEPPEEAAALVAQAETLSTAGDAESAGALLSEADTLTSRSALAHSFAGRMGRLIEPIVAPLGFDWQIGIGVVSSFAAREVIVSTLAIVYGVGADAAEENSEGLYATLRKASRADGSLVFTTATSLSLLVFYVLAMQCLPTQAVTKRETGTWSWAILQFVYMTVLAYGAAYITYQVALMFTSA